MTVFVAFFLLAEHRKFNVGRPAQHLRLHPSMRREPRPADNGNNNDELDNGLHTPTQNASGRCLGRPKR